MSEYIRFLIEESENRIEDAVFIGRELALDGFDEQHLEVALVDLVDQHVVLVVMDLVQQLVTVDVGVLPLLVY